MSETATQTAPDDIRSAAMAAFDDFEKTAVETPDEPTTPEVTPRGPDGKFQPRDTPKETPAAEPVEQPASEIAEKPDKPASSQPPQTWKQSDKELFAKQPVEAQEFLLRRHKEMEADYTQKTQAIAEFKRDYEPIAQMFAPHRAAMSARGFTPASLVQAWANVEQALMAGRGAEVIRDIANGYRIDKATIARALGLPTSTQAAQDPPAPDGQTPALPPELLARLNNTERWIAAEAQARQQAVQQAQQQAATRVMSQIDQFATAQDKAGNLLHPYFHEVEDDMTRLALAVRAGGREPVLSELYEQAVRANPATYQRLIDNERAAWEAQRTAAEKKREDEARAKAAAAQKAGKSVTGSPGAGQPPRRGTGSLRDQLEEAAEQLSI